MGTPATFNLGLLRKQRKSRLSSSACLHHTTHLTQPWIKGVLALWKCIGVRNAINYITCNPGRVVTRYQFSELFSRAWYKGMSMSNIMSGFQITGIFPFNRHALRPCSEPQPRSVPEGSGLKYIPLFSPTPARHRSQAVTPSFSDISFPDLFSPREYARILIPRGLLVGHWPMYLYTPSYMQSDETAVAAGELSKIEVFVQRYSCPKSVCFLHVLVMVMAVRCHKC